MAALLRCARCEDRAARGSACIWRGARIRRRHSSKRRGGAIRVQTDLVNILASVTDANGRPDPRSHAGRFQISEEGVPQKIERFEARDQPPARSGLDGRFEHEHVQGLEVRDGSGRAFHPSGGAARRHARRIRICGERDAALANFPTTCRSCRRPCGRIAPGAGTSIYDAVVLGSNALRRRPAGRRRAIVLVTDAGETTSVSKFEDARRAAIASGDAALYRHHPPGEE